MSKYWPDKSDPSKLIQLLEVPLKFHKSYANACTAAPQKYSFYPLSQIKVLSQGPRHTAGISHIKPNITAAVLLTRGGWN